jgi:hypothetical protein
VFKNELYNERVRFVYDGTNFDYYVDNMTITLRKIQKRRVLSDYRVIRKFRGYHLDISLTWTWFRSFPGTAKENDILTIYKELLTENQIIFVANPEDSTPLQLTVRDPNDTFDLVAIAEKVRTGNFTMQLETVEMITDLNLINPLGFQIL